MLELQIVYWTLSDEHVALIYDTEQEFVLKINISKNTIEKIQDWKFDILDAIDELDVKQNIQFGQYAKDGIFKLLNELIEDGTVLSEENESKVLEILKKEKEK